MQPNKKLYIIIFITSKYLKAYWETNKLYAYFISLIQALFKLQQFLHSINGILIGVYI